MNRLGPSDLRHQFEKLVGGCRLLPGLLNCLSLSADLDQGGVRVPNGLLTCTQLIAQCGFVLLQLLDPGAVADCLLAQVLDSGCPFADSSLFSLRPLELNLEQFAFAVQFRIGSSSGAGLTDQRANLPQVMPRLLTLGRQVLYLTGRFLEPLPLPPRRAGLLLTLRNLPLQCHDPGRFLPSPQPSGGRVDRGMEFIDHLLDAA